MMIETGRKNNLEAENAMLIELLKMATEVIDVAIANGYNASPNERRKMHDTLDEVINHGFHDEWLESHDNDMTSTIKALETDNTKLRELVRTLYYCNLPYKDCDKCSMNGADMHVAVGDMEFCDGLRGLMRELGIDVIWICHECC